MSRPTLAPEPTMEEILASIRRIISESDDGQGLSGSAAPHSGRGDPARAAQAAASYERGSAPRQEFGDEAPADHGAYPDADRDIPSRPAATGDHAFPARHAASADEIFELTDEMVAEDDSEDGPEFTGERAPAASADPVDEPFHVPDRDEPDAMREEPSSGGLETIYDLGEDSAAQGAADPAPNHDAPYEEPVGELAAAADNVDPVPDVSAALASAGTAPPADQTTSGEGLLSARSDAMVASAFGRLADTLPPGAPAGAPAREPRTLEDVVGEMLRPMLKEWLDDNLPAIVEQLVRQEIERVSRSRR